jgi:hypothetical protein
MPTTYVVPAPPPAAQPVPQTVVRERVVEEAAHAEEHERHVTVIGHSPLYYWWPVWVVGYLMAIFTWSYGNEVQVGNSIVNVHPSNNVGVLFFLTLFLVILISNVAVRGLASVVVILLLVLTSVIMAYYRVWDDVLGWFGNLTVYMNQGAYFWFSTLMFLTWFLTVFVFDRMNYWVFKPGQVTYQKFWGAGSESYDTENMNLEKHRDDLFRHWLLGLGSGDLKIHTHGPKGREIHIPNVLFIGFKVDAIQHLIATEPAAARHPVRDEA